jgi:phosphatidylserine synthase
MRALDDQMPRSSATGIGRRPNTYTGYSIGCAAVWAVILVVAQRRLDSQNRNMLRLVCGGWWSGWTSATIARAGYPPPQKLKPESQKKIAIVSIVLVAVGLISVIRLLITGNRQRGRLLRLLLEAL